MRFLRVFGFGGGLGGRSFGYKVFVAYKYIFIEKLLHTKLLIVFVCLLFVLFCFVCVYTHCETSMHPAIIGVYFAFFRKGEGVDVWT